jgi:hypothetical protein
MKINILWKKIPTWIKVLIPSIISGLIVSNISTPVNIFLNNIFLFLVKVFKVNIPGIIPLCLAILALVLYIKNRRGKNKSVAKIVLKYPNESIALLEGLAGRPDKMLEKRDIIAAFAKGAPPFRISDIQILLEDLCTHDLIGYSTSYRGDDDREFYNITTLGFEYLYVKTRKT